MPVHNPASHAARAGRVNVFALPYQIGFFTHTCSVSDGPDGLIL